MPMGIEPMSTAAMVAMALQAAGTVAQSMGRDKVNDAQDQATQQYLARQRDLSNNSIATTNAALEKVAPEQQKQSQQQATDTLTQNFSKAVTNDAVNSYVPDNPGAPKVVKDTQAAAMTKALDLGKSYAATKAPLSAVPLVNQTNGIAINRAGETVGANNNFMGGNKNILDFQLQDANRKAAPYNTVSDIANGIGGLASLYSLTKGRLPTIARLAGGSGGVNGSAGDIATANLA